MADQDEQMGRDESESLLAQAENSLSGSAADEALAFRMTSPGDAASTVASSAYNTSTKEEGIQPGDVEALLHHAQAALDSVEQSQDALPAGVKRFELSDLSGAPASEQHATLDLVRDVELDLKIELGRTRMHLEDVLKLKHGAVVPLDKLAGDPVDIFVNGRLIARGEVLVLNDNFCVRVAELISGEPAA